MINDLRFVFWTNESNLHLMQITLDQFFKYNRLNNIKVSVMMNDFDDNTHLPHSNKVQYLKAGVPFDSVGKHFGKSLIEILPKIKEEYIFYFCDDYMFIKDTKWEDLKTLMNFIRNNNVDYFGFDEINPHHLIHDFEPYSGTQPELFQQQLQTRKNSYRYLFSVQPCIWKRDSLLNLVKKYPNINLHDLDETLEVIRNDNELKTFGINLESHFTYDEREEFEYFIIAYIEIVRHGVFHYPDNGYMLNSNSNIVKFIDEIISKYNLHNRPEFKKLICDIK